MNWLQSGRSQRIQDVVEAFPECKWAEIFEALEALTQSRRVSFEISGSELELRAFSHRRPKYGVEKAPGSELVS